MKKRLIRQLTIFLVLLPTISMAAGTNFFMQGMSHPFMIPAQLIVVFSLGLLLGQQGWPHLRIALPGFAVAIASGLILTRYFSMTINSEMILLPLAAITGILVVLKLQLPVIMTLLIAVASAAVVGFDSAVPFIPGLQARKIYESLVGTGLSVTGTLVIVSLVAFLLRNLLQGVALRVLGAWATAGAILVLALLLATQGAG